MKETWLFQHHCDDLLSRASQHGGKIFDFGQSFLTVAENNMIASTKLAIMAATNQAGGGDCDGDMIVEPIPAEDPAGLPVPAGGGLLPATIGASLQDPWNTRYALCAWDHGANNARCGGTAGLIAGGPTEDQYVLAVISAGPDRQFQTTCRAYVDANTDNIPDQPLLEKPAGSDDLVLGYTYAEANSAGGGLWILKSGDPDKATIVKDLEVRTADDANVAFALDRNTGQAEFLALKTDNIFARTSPNGVISLHDTLRIKSLAGMAAPPGGGGGGGGADNLGNHIATQNVQFLPAAGGLGVTGAEADPKVGTLTSGKWCTTNGSVINCTADEPSGGGGGDLQWDPGLTTCDSSNYAKMMYADGALIVCGEGGFRNVTVGTSNYTPAPPSTGGYFVVTADGTNGNLGGLAGANAFCLSQLTNNAWRGRAEAMARGILVAGKVRAFLCDGSTCQNGQPNTTYTMASAFKAGTNTAHLKGGRTFTTNASGQGPNAAIGFADGTAAWTGEALGYEDGDGNPGVNYWTGRSAGSANLWSNTAHGSRCSNWTSTGGDGMTGGTYMNANTRNWSLAAFACSNSSRRLLCFVDP